MIDFCNWNYENLLDDICLTAAIFALGKAVLAIYRSLAAWLERDRAFFFTIRARRGVHFTRLSVKSISIGSIRHCLILYSFGYYVFCELKGGNAHGLCWSRFTFISLRFWPFSACCFCLWIWGSCLPSLTSFFATAVERYEHNNRVVNYKCSVAACNRVFCKPGFWQIAVANLF